MLASSIHTIQVAIGPIAMFMYIEQSPILDIDIQGAFLTPSLTISKFLHIPFLHTFYSAQVFSIGMEDICIHLFVLGIWLGIVSEAFERGAQQCQMASSIRALGRML